MRSELQNLLQKFLDGNDIPPLLVSDESVLESIRIITGRAFSAREELMKEVIDDVFVFAPEESGESFKIKLAREMSEKAHLKSSGAFKVFVAYDIDDLTTGAANSLLKVFEDVPQRTLFLLVVASKEQLPETLLSRMIFIDSNDDFSVLSLAIREKIDQFFQGDRAPLYAFLQAAKASDLDRKECGLILKALIHKAKEGYIQDYHTIDTLLKALATIASTNANPRWVLDTAVLAL